MTKVFSRSFGLTAPLRAGLLLRVLAATFCLLATLGKAAHAAPTIADLCESNSAYLSIAKSDLGAPFNMHFVSFVKNLDGTPALFNGQMRAYYIKVNGASQLGVGLATTPDGINFTDQGLVLQPTPGAWDSGMSSFPGVWYDNGTTYMVYEGAGGAGNPGDVGLASSSDGVNFTKHGRILQHNATGWESANIGTPSIIKVGGVWYVYYHVCVLSRLRRRGLPHRRRVGQQHFRADQAAEPDHQHQRQRLGFGHGGASRRDAGVER